MKNTKKKMESFTIVKLQAVRSIAIIAIVAVIGLSFTACGDDNGNGDGGKLTITGLGAHDGKYVVAYSNDIHNDGTYAAQSYNWDDMTGTGGKITDGKVTLNVWHRFDVSSNRGPYSGSDSNVTFDVFIHETATTGNGFGLNTKPFPDGTVTVSFTDGVGEGAFTPSD